MKHQLTHFAIHIEDIDRAKKFYNGVFDWGFNSYGQDDFAQITAGSSGDGPPIGALQSRKYSPIPDKIIGFECTIGVENLDECIDKVLQNGGNLQMPKTTIPFVGYIAKFLDTEGNLFCAMQYDQAAK